MSGLQISTSSPSYLSGTPEPPRSRLPSAFSTALTIPSLQPASAHPALLPPGVWVLMRCPIFGRSWGHAFFTPTLTFCLCLSFCPLLLSSPQTTWARTAESLDLGGGGWRRTISCQEAPPSLGPGAGRPHYLSALLGQAVVRPCCDKGHRPLSPPLPPLPALPESARPPACFSRLPR